MKLRKLGLSICALVMSGAFLIPPSGQAQAVNQVFTRILLVFVGMWLTRKL